MKVIVLGCGKIGSVMARDFSQIFEGSQITMSDISRERASNSAYEIGATWTRLDTYDYSAMVKKIKKFDMVLGALPGDLGYSAQKAAVEAGVDMVDVSFTPEDPLGLDEAAMKAGVTIIPDCGVAPGLSNLLVGYSASRLDTLDEAHILVGGIPETPVPPLGYAITWSADGLIDEYTRDVSIIVDSRNIQVPALSGLEEIDFPGVGKLEAFYTDGLRSLVKSFPKVKSMYEKTLRYPGHVEKIKLLRELGFFSEEPLIIDTGTRVSPKFITARIFERSLWNPEIGDILAMRIEVIGEVNGMQHNYRYKVLERFDQETGISAMARTTAFTAAIVAKMLALGKISLKGVIPMEKLGMNHKFVRSLISNLEKKGVQIKETGTCC
jgi:saccharopine dehydrogenase-like NADP-dependent oxidoreductase